MRELHLFAGAGGGILGGILCGHTCVCAVEIDQYRRQILLQRQRDGILPRFPIWDDIRTFDGKPWLGRVDCVCGGFPCQDISLAGEGDGLEGERSGLWFEMRRVISEVGPAFVFVENSPALVIRGLGRVLGDLSEMGYDARWGIVSAKQAGAPHLRERLFILGHTNQARLEGHTRNGKRSERRQEATRHVAKAGIRVLADRAGTPWNDGNLTRCRDDKFRIIKPGLGGMAHGVVNFMDRIESIGDGQVPSVVRLSWEILR